MKISLFTYADSVIISMERETTGCWKLNKIEIKSGLSDFSEVMRKMLAKSSPKVWLLITD